MLHVLSETARLALTSFQNDTIVLLNHEPLYAYLLVDTRTVLTRQIDVAAVSMADGDFVFYLNPEGYLSYTQGERLFIIKHEWTHWIDEHPLDAVLYHDKELWNLACDLAINQDLETEYCHRPKDAQMPEHYNLPPNLTPQQYYGLLVDMKEKGQFDIPDSLTEGARGQSRPSENEDEGEGNIRGYITKKKRLSNGVLLIRIDYTMIVFQSDENFYDKNGKALSFDDLHEGEFAESFAFTSEGGWAGEFLRLTEPTESEKKENQSSSSSERSEKKKTVQSNILKNMHPEWDDAQSQSPQMVKHHIDETIKKAAETIGNHLPAKLQEKIKRMNKNQSSFKGELRLFVGKTRGQRKQYTYRKKNKRNPNMPGVKKGPRLRLVVIFDTSFSITQSQLELFDAELRNLYRTNKDIHLVVMTCDTAVRDVFLYDRRIMKEDLVLGGRGGTDFRPAFEMIEKKEHKLLKNRPDGILYLTDGGGVAPNRFPIPTLWCLTANGHLPYIDSFQSGRHVEWGHVVRLPE